ncbi:MAG: acyl-CoA thioesterase [Proteobacteria bacterium]|nr:acyl-CoA thioesterase [Pseudomonadota bacterium]MBU4298264.1 acyl-CoA thioesterase [Pseudomonadota bacterium]MCG2747532.1 acyl-CoA thioesterase [Desulfobulbaceae bacterium]
MPSLKISITEPAHVCSYRVLYGDTDAGGVVYNANYLRFFELARSSFMRHYASSYKEIEDAGFILPVVETYLRYKAPARYDDLLTIKTSMQQISNYSWRFNHHVLLTASDKLLVKGFTVHACVNKTGKLAKLPPEYLVRIAAVASAPAP